MIISHKYRFVFIKTTKVGGTSLELKLDKLCAPDDIFPPHWQEEKGFNSRNQKGIFNPIPEIAMRIKGCRSLRNAGIIRTWENLIAGEKFFESIPAWQLKCRIPKKIWDGYYKFTIERNPWDKCVSRYFHSKAVFEKKYNKELTFQMWFDYFLKRLRTPWNTTAWGSEAPYNYPRYADPWSDEILVEKVCRYENLNDELHGIFKILGVPFDDLQGYNAKGEYRKDRRHYREFLPDGYKDKIADIFKKEIHLMGYKY